MIQAQHLQTGLLHQLCRVLQLQRDAGDKPQAVTLHAEEGWKEASEYDIGIADVVEFAGLALGLGPTITPRSMRSLLVWSTMM